jgi:protein phosphatase
LIDGGAIARRLDIVLPDPSLVVLMGPAGAGKSTFAQRWFAPEEILSSDALRAVVSGDPADQSASAAAFAILHRQLGRRLGAGLLTVVDATNVRRPGRRSLLLRARRAGRPAVAIVLNLPASLVHQRNAGRRERVVEPGVVDRQLADLGRTLAGQLGHEGFSAVHVLSSATDVDGVRLVRARTAPP